MEWRQSMQGRGEPPVSYTIAWCEAELAEACAANTGGGEHVSYVGLAVHVRGGAA